MKLALKPRGEVEKLIGKPTAPADSHDYLEYPWGTVRYGSGGLKELEYHFKIPATSVADALQRLGLKKTSNPRETIAVFFWREEDGPSFVCCGIKSSSLVVSKALDPIKNEFVSSSFDRIEIKFSRPTLPKPAKINGDVSVM